MEKKNIVISGWYGVPNCGDEALLDVFCEQISLRANVTVTVISGHSSGLRARYGGIPIIGVKHGYLVGRRSILFWLKGRSIPLLKALFKADLLVVGGGSLIRDVGTKGNLFRILDDIFIVGMLGKPTCLYSIGMGPFIHSKSRGLVNKALKYCRYISVRDKNSAALIDDDTKSKVQNEIVPDPGLLLAPAQSLSNSFDGLLAFLSIAPKQTVFIYPVELDEVPSGVSEEEGIKLISSSLSLLAQQHNLRFAFIPFQSQDSNNDLVIAQKIIDLLEGNVDTFILPKPPEPKEAVSLVSLPLFNISIRLHAFIFCVSQQAPVIALNYQHKILNVAKQFGLEQCVYEIDKELPRRLLSIDSISHAAPLTETIVDSKLLESNRVRLHSMFDTFVKLLK